MWKQKASWNSDAACGTWWSQSLALTIKSYANSGKGSLHRNAIDYKIPDCDTIHIVTETLATEVRMIST